MQFIPRIKFYDHSSQFRSSSYKIRHSHYSYEYDHDGKYQKNQQQRPAKLGPKLVDKRLTSLTMSLKRLGRGNRNARIGRRKFSNKCK